jgi:hypothetical protein
MNVTYNQNRGGNTITITVERPGTSSTFGSSSIDFDLAVPSMAILQLQEQSTPTSQEWSWYTANSPGLMPIAMWEARHRQLSR